jgi:hypothetical protein
MGTPKGNEPAWQSGLDSEALVGADSEVNYPSFHGERKGAVEDFVAEMYRYVPPELRILKMQFRGDPAVDADWWAKPLAHNAAVIDDDANVYFTVSAFRKDGTYRRRKVQFGGGVLLMIDDLGTGSGAKFPRSKIDELPPTALIETSPDNFQAIFMFDRLVTDQAQFNALIDAFVREKFLDQDPGMKGVTRVFRPPFGINGKPKYGGWRVRLALWAPQCRYSVEEIAAAFRLDLIPPRSVRRRCVPRSLAANRIDEFKLVEKELHRLGMVRGVPRDDKLDIHCPWEGEHSQPKETGAAILAPGADNNWSGGFKCHHGSCEGRGWRDLTDWLADEHAEVLAQINRTAPDWRDLTDWLEK